MNWGSIDREFVGFVSKRLSATEVDPRTSNYHEFQGTRELFDLLGKTERRKIPADYCLMRDAGTEPGWDQVIRSTASWYDSRKGKPRRPEWRLYYSKDADMIQSRCRAGDLLIIGLRRDESLAVIIAPSDSASAVFLKNVLNLAANQTSDVGEFEFNVASKIKPVELSGAEALDQLTFRFTETAPNAPVLFGKSIISPADLAPHDLEVERLTDELIERWPKGRLGSSAEVCALVASTCQGDEPSQPDATLVRWLEVAEVSYRRWEAEMMSRYLKPLRADHSIADAELAERISERWMSYRQSRVSRAGEAMELFVERILRAARLKFVRHARIEGGKRPDFLFPSKAAYESPGAVDRVRILGSKTSFKDRWRQILAEGNRIKVKHGITRDLAISPNLFQQMDSDGLVVVMPEPVLSRYADRPAKAISMSQFIAEVKGLQA